MKQIAKSLIVAGALVTAGTASADWFDCFSPIIGVDYYQAWMKGKNNWSQIFPKSYPGATVYVGAKFDDFFGVELGYDTSTRKSHDFTIAAGQGFFNGTATSNVTGSTRIRREGGHLDLIGYYPMCECWELFGSIGWGWLRPKISMNINNNGTPVGSALASISGKTRSLFRIGVGTDYMLTDMLGVRAKLGWESTSSLRVTGNNSFYAAGFNQKAFKGSTTVAVGAFVQF